MLHPPVRLPWTDRHTDCRRKNSPDKQAEAGRQAYRLPEKELTRQTDVDSQAEAGRQTHRLPEKGPGTSRHGKAHHGAASSIVNPGKEI